MSARLSDRLLAIAALVTPGHRLADVGCDHAYLPIELVRIGRIPSALAMDVREGPLERARAHVEEAGCADCIATRRSDGLERLKEDEADTVLIAGMGGLLICRILTAHPIPESVNELVLAPQSEAADVRRCVRDLGFFLVDEDMIFEDGKFYPILRACRGKEPRSDSRSASEIVPVDLADAFGPILLTERHPVLHRWLLKELDATEAILQHLKDVMQGLPPRDTLENRAAELERKKEQIQSALTYYRSFDTGISGEKVIYEKGAMIVRSIWEASMITLNINGEPRRFPEGTPFRDLAREYQKDYDQPILLVRFDNILCELHKTVLREGKVEFVTTAEKPGRSTYCRTVTLLLAAALFELYPEDRVVVQHSLGQGYYCEFRNGTDYVPADEARIAALKEKMQDMAAQDLPITKRNVKKQEAIDYFRSIGRDEKARLLRYRRHSRVNLYEVNGYRDYYYGYMAPSAGCCPVFDLVPYQKGIMLLFPDPKDSTRVAEFQPLDKLFHTMDDAATWGESMGVRTIADLNDVIADGGIQDLILVQESRMEQTIGEIAGQIAGDPKKKIILIAGPSSSGKTTFSHRLSIQLAAHGLRPHPISLDDFYVNREDTPLDENGEYDFECLEAIDIPLLNQSLNDLLSGREVTLPVFNFRTGHREERPRPTKLADGDVLVVEGIHGLNEKLTAQIPAESKFKIYISALTQLNVDSQNNLSTTDTRLIRRMVRDAHARNTSATGTLTRWDSVRRGEEKNIFPYQEEADVMFNSALIYELAVLKCYAEPLLFSVDETAPEYEEAKRLLKILDYTLPVPGEDIGHNSILREFMGGGCFGL